MMQERFDVVGKAVKGALGRHRAKSFDAPAGRSSTGPSETTFSKPSAAKSERGQAMVEIAFVLPLFLLFVFAIIEIGRAWGARQVLTIAAREGARILILPYGAGLTYGSEEDAQAAALNIVKESLNG